MAIKEEAIIIHRTDENGDKVMQFPYTKKEYVEGLIVDLPVGHMYFSLEPTVPVGRLPALGATYNRKLYADLWSYAQERGLVISESEWQQRASANGGNCAYYSDGNGSTTFRVPSMKCWVRGANGIEEVGSYLEAGLPNITGFAAGFPWNAENHGAWTDKTETTKGPTGAFYGDGWSRSGKSDGREGTSTSFDASRSNAIYGNSDTVQPCSLVGVWLIVAYGFVTNVGDADVANVMRAVEGVQTQRRVVDVSIQEAILKLIYSDATFKQVSLPDITVTHGVLHPDSNKYEATIPLPVGYTREQCKYAVCPYGWSDHMNLSVNQSTGVVHCESYDSEYNQPQSFQYICIAIKVGG